MKQNPERKPWTIVRCGICDQPKEWRGSDESESVRLRVCPICDCCP